MHLGLQDPSKSWRRTKFQSRFEISLRKFNLQWFDPDRLISETEHEEFLQDQQEDENLETYSDHREPQYMNYDPEYIFPQQTYSIQRRSLDGLPYRDHIYSHDYDNYRGRPKSAPSHTRPKSAGSARSTLADYEDLASRSAREAQVLFVEGISTLLANHNKKTSIDQKAKFLSKPNI